MTDKQKNILEMTKDICRVKHNCNDPCNPISACDALRYAERAVEAGYVKQSEGEWIYVHTYMRGRCSICQSSMQYDNQPYCANCGAKMKGGAE